MVHSKVLGSTLSSLAAAIQRDGGLTNVSSNGKFLQHGTSALTSAVSAIPSDENFKNETFSALVGASSGLVSADGVAGVLGGMFCGVGSFVGSFTSVLLLLGLCLCWRSCQLRDLWCVKWCLRCAGCDPFDEFECIIVVHEISVQRLSGKSKVHSVRVTAGRHSVCTSSTARGDIQEPLGIIVEQGVSVIDVDLCQGGLLIATLPVSVREVHDGTLSPKSQTFPMLLKACGFCQPLVKLSITKGDLSAEPLDYDAGGANGRHPISMSPSVLLRLHFDAGSADLSGDSEAQAEAAVEACNGPLVLSGSWGNKLPVFFGVSRRIHKDRRRYSVGFWGNETDFKRGMEPQESVDVLHVQNVASHSGSKNVFVLNFMVKGRLKTWMLEPSDRSRNIWVEHIALIISHARNAHGRALASQSSCKLAVWGDKLRVLASKGRGSAERAWSDPPCRGKPQRASRLGQGGPSSAGPLSDPQSGVNGSPSPRPPRKKLSTPLPTGL